MFGFFGLLIFAFLFTSSITLKTKLITIVIAVCLIVSFNLNSKREKAFKLKKEKLRNSHLETRIKEIKDSLIKHKDYDPSVFTYRLPQTSIVYKVKILKVNKKIVKNSLHSKTNISSESIKKDGYKLSIVVSLTNPTNEKMKIPIPTRMSIQSIEGNNRGRKTSYDFISYNCKIINEKGNDLNEIGEGKCNIPDYSFECTTFMPNETRIFSLVYNDIIDLKYNFLVFQGFDKSGPIGVIIETIGGSVVGEHYFSEIYEDEIRLN